MGLTKDAGDRATGDALGRRREREGLVPRGRSKEDHDIDMATFWPYVPSTQTEPAVVIVHMRNCQRCVAKSRQFAHR